MLPEQGTDTFPTDDVMEIQVEMEGMKSLVLTRMEVLAPFGSGGCVDEVLGTSGNADGG